MTFWQELGVAEVIMGELSSFASGTPATITRQVSGYSVSATVTHLPNGPAGTGYQVFSGSLWQIFGLILGDAAAIQGGAPVQIAEKVGNTWYGETISVTKAP